MVKRISYAGKKLIFLLSLVALLLQQLSLVLCDASAPAPEHTAADQYGTSRRTCNATIEECNLEDEEMMMESEISRRFLAAGGYIGVDALRKDQHVCRNKDGKSYNCGIGSPVNKQSRGCEAKYYCKQGHH